MILKAERIGKKYGKHWVFRDFSFEIKSGISTAIVGKNGAGKSTLLQILAGYLTPSEGEIYLNEKPLEPFEISATLIGPYTEIIEEFTLHEFLSFHSRFKEPNLSIEEMAIAASLPLEKSISDFSTGMKQRVKLLTAFYFSNDFVFFDEPTANLDDEGFAWWESFMQEETRQIILVASNDKREIAVCKNKIGLDKY
jgi:ABC-type multidrug transport system ATPase subunit